MHKWKIHQASPCKWLWLLGQRTGSTLAWNLLRNCGHFLCLGGERRRSRDGDRCSSRSFSLPSSRPRHLPAGGNAVAWSHGMCKQYIHPRAVVDKTFTNLVREKCGHLYCRVVKSDISGAIGAHESQKEVKTQMDINVH